MGCRFDAALSGGLRDLARRERTLLANAMVAVYAAVLWRWCGQKDFVLPFMVAGRQAEHKSVVGYFAHILYLRIELSGAETFSELLRRVSNELFRALMHQDFGRMARERPELSSGAFFQWITWHTDEALPSIAGPAPGAQPLSAEHIPIRTFGEGLTAIPPGMVDVEVTAFDTAEGIYFSGVYRADRFSAESMSRFADDLRKAAERFVQDPHASLEATA